MKSSIGAVTLLALAAAGSAGTIDIASAAKVITVSRAPIFTPARDQRVYDRGGDGAYDTSRYDSSRYDHSRYDHSPYDHSAYDRSGGWSYYYGRPYYYAPAPFPLGFDFGFGW
jgi:hypothetical protein